MFRRSYYSSNTYYGGAGAPSYGGGYGQPAMVPGGYGGYPGAYPGAYPGGYPGGYGPQPMLPQEMYNPRANLYGPMAMFRPYDRDGDGMITENDFVIALRENGMGFIGDVMARAAFRKLDKNRNGRLDMHEAVRAMKYLRPDLYY